jgi:peptidoglycan/xylan/chitin deacetylase (PgdA/CDA1 family)
VPSGSPGATDPPGPSPSPAPTPSPSAKPSKHRRSGGTRGTGTPGGYIWHGPSDQKWLALTFDLDLRPGMDAVRNTTRWYDPRIIDLLETTGTHATIFMNGLFAKAYPEIVRRLAANPNLELANHSWDHADWTVPCTGNDQPMRPPMTKRREVLKSARKIEEVSGIRVRYFRFPAFCKSAADVRLVNSLGETPIGTSCAFGDGLDYSSRRQVQNVKATCGRGSIVVTHLNGPPYHHGVYEALRQLLPWWEKHGWRIVTVGTLIGAPTPR